MHRLYPTENPDSILRQIRGDSDPALEGRHGRVVSVTGNVAHVEGMPEVGLMDCVEFNGGARGLAWQLLKRSVSVLLTASPLTVEPGSLATATGSQLRVPVGRELLGRVVNYLGEPVDGGPPLGASAYRGIGQAPPPMTRVRRSFQRIETGNAGVDLIMPLAKGSSQLVIGDRSSGKTSLACSIIIQQSERNETIRESTAVYCVYVAVGQAPARISAFVHAIRARGALDHTVVVVATDGELPGAKIVAPHTAEAIAGHFRDQGCHALVIYDDITRYAEAFREIGLETGAALLRERNASEVLKGISLLVEGACHLNGDSGGGSLTVLAVTETQAEDLSEFIVSSLLAVVENVWVFRSYGSEKGIALEIDLRMSFTRPVGFMKNNVMYNLSRFAASRMRVTSTLGAPTRYGASWLIDLLEVLDNDVNLYMKEWLDSAKAVTSCLYDWKLRALSVGEKAVLAYVIAAIPGSYGVSTRGRQALLKAVFRLNPSLREKVIRDRGLTEESAACLERLIEPAFKAAFPDGV